jgi:SAM-dependent methyltransferase
MLHSFERAFYENSEYWVPGRYKGADEERVQLAIQWLPPDVRSVLDVGCGNGILANRLYQAKRVVGIDRSLAALRWVKASRCLADAAFPPFRDNAFDVVVAMEMIEHLPFSLFRPARAGLARIARRYLLVSVPYREDRDGLQITCPLCGCHFHPYQHMRSFEQADMERLFEDWGAFTLVRLSAVVPVRVFRFPWLRKAMRRILGRKSRFPWYALCPQCGYSGHIPPEAQASERQRGSLPFWRRFLRKVWPKESSYIWWMALYEKK